MFCCVDAGVLASRYQKFEQRQYYMCLYLSSKEMLRVLSSQVLGAVWALLFQQCLAVLRANWKFFHSEPRVAYGSKNMTETSSMLNSLAAGYLLPVLGALGPCLTLVHYKFTRNLTQPVFSTNKTRAPLLKCQTFSFSYKPILLLRPDFTERLHCFFVITSYSLSSACHIG